MSAVESISVKGDHAPWLPAATLAECDDQDGRQYEVRADRHGGCGCDDPLQGDVRRVLGVRVTRMGKNELTVWGTKAEKPRLVKNILVFRIRISPPREYRAVEGDGLDDGGYYV